MTPPLRGPDEAAHFLRAYGISTGELIPSATDGAGHRGFLLPAYLHEDLVSYEKTRSNLIPRGAGRPVDHQGSNIFTLYEGSEAYTPVAYLSYVAGAAIGRLEGFRFATMIYLMRLAGLAAGTALVTYAIWATPRLKWAFVLIAMLPAALYGRSVISADGSVLGLAMIVTALCFRGLYKADRRTWERCIWMTLCALSKPPQIAFILLEAIPIPFKQLLRSWRMVALVAMPGVLLSPLWIWVVSGDAAAWRMVEWYGVPAGSYDPVRKFWFMLAHPLHFPTALLTTLAEVPELWQMLIGRLGWNDTALAAWVYPVLSFMLIAAGSSHLDLNFHARIRVALVGGFVVLGYIFAVFLIFYISFTPPDTMPIQQVHGRYFIPILPAMAFVFSAFLNRGLPHVLISIIGILGAILGGCAVIEAILRVDWLPGWILEYCASLCLRE